MQISDSYVSTNTSYELTAINDVIQTPLHLYFTLLAYALYKYACHIAHVYPTVLIL